MEKKPDLTDEQIEIKAKESLAIIHQFSTLTINDEEDNIFHQGYHAGYREAERSLQSQNERLLSALKETLDYVYGADPELYEKLKQLINDSGER